MRTRKVRGLTEYSFASVLIFSALILVVIVILNIKSSIDLLLFAVVLFPFAQRKLATIEKESFNLAIRYENIYAPLSSTLFFVFSAVLTFLNVDHSVLLFSRFFFLFICILFFVPVKIDFKWRLSELRIGDLPLAVISVFVFKGILYTQLDVTKSNDDNSSKLFLIVYDILAMAYGYSVRRFLSRNQDGNILSLYKVTVLYGIVILCLSVVCFTFYSSMWPFLLLGSFAVAGIFNFVISDKSYLVTFIGVNLISGFSLYWFERPIIVLYFGLACLSISIHMSSRIQR
jgi:hypothetical protein